jgi:hypothetical protein
VECYVECPSDLAEKLVAMEIEPGDAFRINQTQKTASGNWRYNVDEEEPDLS